MSWFAGLAAVKRSQRGLDNARSNPNLTQGSSRGGDRATTKSVRQMVMWSSPDRCRGEACVTPMCAKAQRPYGDERQTLEQDTIFCRGDPREGPHRQ